MKISELFSKSFLTPKSFLARRRKALLVSILLVISIIAIASIFVILLKDFRTIARGNISLSSFTLMLFSVLILPHVLLFQAAELKSDKYYSSFCILLGITCCSFFLTNFWRVLRQFFDLYRYESVFFLLFILLIALTYLSYWMLLRKTALKLSTMFLSLLSLMGIVVLLSFKRGMQNPFDIIFFNGVFVVCSMALFPPLLLYRQQKYRGFTLFCMSVAIILLGSIISFHFRTNWEFLAHFWNSFQGPFIGISLIVLSMTVTSTALLLLMDLKEEQLRILRKMTIFISYISAVLLEYILLSKKNLPDIYYRLLGILFTLTILGTVAIPFIKELKSSEYLDHQVRG